MHIFFKIYGCAVWNLKSLLVIHTSENYIYIYTYYIHSEGEGWNCGTDPSGENENARNIIDLWKTEILSERQK